MIHVGFCWRVGPSQSEYYKPELLLDLRYFLCEVDTSMQWFWWNPGDLSNYLIRCVVYTLHVPSVV